MQGRFPKNAWFEFFGKICIKNQNHKTRTDRYLQSKAKSSTTKVDFSIIEPKVSVCEATYCTYLLPSLGWF
jgi:hypothetical protein